MFLFYVLVSFWPWGIWDLSSLTRGWTGTPLIGALTIRPPGKSLRTTSEQVGLPGCCWPRCLSLHTWEKQGDGHSVCLRYRRTVILSTFCRRLRMSQTLDWSLLPDHISASPLPARGLLWAALSCFHILTPYFPSWSHWERRNWVMSYLIPLASLCLGNLSPGGLVLCNGGSQ